MRYRVRAEPNPVGRKTQTLNGAVTVTTTALPDLEKVITEDVEVPQFHKRQAAGEIFNNPFISDKRSFIVNDVYDASATTSSTNLHVVCDRSLLYSLVNDDKYPSPPVTDFDEASLRSQIMALSNINATEFDTGTFAAEWSKTKRLHRDLGNALIDALVTKPKVVNRKAKFVKTVLYDHRGSPILNRKGQPVFRYQHESGVSELTAGRVATNAKSIANLYLTVRYGLLPLVHDLEDATKYLRKQYNFRHTARGSELFQQISSPSSFTVDDATGFWTIRCQTSRTWSVRHGVLYEGDFLSAQLAALGVTRPLSTAWEILPWSFVADWFLGVGKWLDAIQPAGLTKTLSAWEVTQDTVVRTATVTGYTVTKSMPPGQNFSGSWNGSIIDMRSRKTRMPWSGSAPFRPAFGSGFNTLRATDFAALVLQKISSR